MVTRRTVYCDRIRWTTERQLKPKSEPETFKKDFEELIAKMYLVKTCRLPAIGPVLTKLMIAKMHLVKFFFIAINQTIRPVYF